MIAQVLRFAALSLLALAPSMATMENDANFEIMPMDDMEPDSFEHTDDDHRNLRRRRSYRFKLKVTNLSVRQPFSPFFVMVHDYSVRLYEFGEEASSQLARLAEDGDPQPLVDFFDGRDGVLSAALHNTDAPYVGGETTEIEIVLNRRYPLVTIASMGINTNDLFVSLNGVRLYRGSVFYSDGLDAGSEENNELCESIPGPACLNINTTNIESGNGEGFVHVHPGFHGVGDLAENRYDWRNPMMRVVAY